MVDRFVSLAVAGSGGAGVVTTGNLLLDAAARVGWHAYMTRSAGPQIRGGEAASMIRLGTAPVESHDDHYDLLVAVDWENVGRFAAELPLGENSVVLGDPQAGEAPPFLVDSPARLLSLPLKALAGEIPGGRANMVALGAIAELIGLPDEPLIEAIRHAIGAKGEAAVEASLASLRAGRNAAPDVSSFPRLEPCTAAPGTRWTITGNEATGLGAVRGGVRFVAAYPITPATEVLEWLAGALPRVGGALVQAEDELASINQIIGASYGGVPALTATSGPGLALMTESLGLAVASEVPIVVVNVMRGGPSTGIPTKSEQTDLNIACYGLHGDAPHLVLAPHSVADCLLTTQWAVHLAETLQTAVIVLTDQATGQARAVAERPAELAFIGQRVVPESLAGYQRYAVTANGISPMAIPGMAGGEYTADGLEHTPGGTPSSQAADHMAQLDKRLRKIAGHNYGECWAEVDGDDDPEVVLLTWGSSTGPCREAMERLRARGLRVRLVAPRLIAPALPGPMGELLAGAQRVLVVEQSHGAQFHHYMRAHYDLPGEVRSLHQPGPLPVRPGTIVKRITDWS